MKRQCQGYCDDTDKQCKDYGHNMTITTDGLHTEQHWIPLHLCAPCAKRDGFSAEEGLIIPQNSSNSTAAIWGRYIFFTSIYIFSILFIHTLFSFLYTTPPYKCCYAVTKRDKYIKQLEKSLQQQFSFSCYITAFPVTCPYGEHRNCAKHNHV